MNTAHSQRSPAQTLVFSTLAVAGLLLAFGLSFWIIIKGAGAGWHNRAQSQLRSPAEEAQANQGWDPNRLLGGLSKQMPAPNSWGDNFGKPLAYTKGIDADSYLYPAGSAPAPGSLILGDGDDSVGTDEDSSTQGAPDGAGGSSANTTDAAPKISEQAAAPAAVGRSPYANSPVNGLLNR